MMGTAMYPVVKCLRLKMILMRQVSVVDAVHGSEEWMILSANLMSARLRVFEKEWAVFLYSV